MPPPEGEEGAPKLLSVSLVSSDGLQLTFEGATVEKEPLTEKESLTMTPLNRNSAPISGDKDEPISKGETEAEVSQGDQKSVDIANSVDADKVVSLKLVFSVPIDRSSIESAFAMEDAEGKYVDGTFVFSDGDTAITFKPSVVIEARDLQQETYLLRVGEDLLSAQGKPIMGRDFGVSINEIAYERGTIAFGKTVAEDGPQGLKAGSGTIVTGIILPMVAAGGSDSFVLRKDGSVWAWGENDKGQLGTGKEPAPNDLDPNNMTTQNKDVPAKLKIRGVKGISAGEHYTFFLKADGSVWGAGYFTGIPTPSFGDEERLPAPVEGLEDIVITALSPGGEDFFLTDEKRVVIAFGSAGDRRTLVEVNETPRWKAVAAGREHYLVLGEDKRVYSWGNDEYGQTGAAGDDKYPGFSRVQFTGAYPDIVDICAGSDHSLALDANGDVWGWGLDQQRQVGAISPDQCDDDRRCHKSATKAFSMQSTNAKAIACGKVHSVALDEDGMVWVWGSDQFGQLGYEARDAVHGHCDYSCQGAQKAVDADGEFIRDVIAVAAGRGHTIALTKDGDVWTWGDPPYVGRSCHQSKCVPGKVQFKE